MHLRAFAVSCVLVLGGYRWGFAQQPTGPASLGNLVTADEASTPPAFDDAAAPKRPAGTVIRPKDGVQHPYLDTAWAKYNASVAMKTDSLKAAIAKQLDLATAKGELDAVEKWQGISEKFESSGELPFEVANVPAISGAASDFKKFSNELFKDYETLMKTLTREKKTDEAKAVRGEMQALAANAKLPDPAKPGPAPGLPRKPDLQSILCGSLWQHRAYAERYVFRPNGQFVLRGTPRSGTYTISPDQKTIILHWNEPGKLKEVIVVGDTVDTWSMLGDPFKPRP